MTQWNLVIDADRGHVAIYSGPEDITLEENPMSDLSRFRYHSGLDYIGFTQVRKTHTIPAVSGSYFATERIDLGAHGKPFTPICMAVLRDWPNGAGTPVDIALSGGVLLDFYGQRPGDAGTMDYLSASGHVDRWSRATSTFFRQTRFDNSWTEKSLMVTAGADGSNLFLHYEQAVKANGGDGASYPAIPLTIDFYVGDRGIDGSSGDAASPALFDSDETGVVMSSTRLAATGTVDGGFDSNRRYLYREDATPLFPMVTSEASEFTSAGTFPNTYLRDVLQFAPNWSFDLKQRFGVPSIPAITPPTVVGLSL